jgi:hypothetical protein
MADKMKVAVEMPSADSLPKPRIGWQGVAKDGKFEHPARIVVRHTWTLYQDAGEWVSEPKIVYEVASSKDAMDELRYADTPLSSIPPYAYLELAGVAAEPVRVAAKSTETK